MDEVEAASGETRYDPVHDRWTIYVPGRADRPGRSCAHRRTKPRKRHDPDCPFCPGNEAQLLEVLSERRDAGADQWSTRIVPNRYPIVVPNAESLAGRHDVVVETPRHDLDFTELDASKRSAVVATWRDRYRELARRWASVVVLRNFGPRAGTSLAHAHSQIIALDRPTPAMAALEARTARHHDRTGRALVHEAVERELDDGTRVIARTRAFACFVPSWAEVPYETWIAPLRRQADFGALGDAEINPLADLLGEILTRFTQRAGDPDYNLMIHGGSRGRRRRADACWFVRIRPHIADTGGFEYASGMAVNPSLPERDAAILRGR